MGQKYRLHSHVARRSLFTSLRSMLAGTIRPFTLRSFNWRRWSPNKTYGRSRTPRIKWVDSWEKNDCDEFFWDWLLGEIKVIFPLHTLLIEQHVVNIYIYLVEREKREKEIEILVVRLHFERRSFKKCDVAVKPKNNVFIWFTFTRF